MRIAVLGASGVAGRAFVAHAASRHELLTHRVDLFDRTALVALLYGPGTGREEGWIDELRDSRFRIPGNGEGWISSVHVEDYGAALVAVLEQGRRHEAYIACDDRPLRLHELYSLAAQHAGVDLPACGGRVGLPSFRVTNSRLRGLGWRPRHAALQARPAPGFVPLS